MAMQLKVISGGNSAEERTILSPEEKFRHIRNVTGSVIQNAQDIWGELWRELQWEVVDGVMILPEAEKGFKPKCGWPEFLEKMCMLQHQLDYAKRFSEGSL